MEFIKFLKRNKNYIIVFILITSYFMVISFFFATVLENFFVIKNMNAEAIRIGTLNNSLGKEIGKILVDIDSRIDQPAKVTPTLSFLSIVMATAICTSIIMSVLLSPES